MARWLQVLDTYSFDIEHRAGKKHGNADAMSCGLCRQCSDQQCLVCMVTRSKKRKEEEEKKKNTPADKKEKEIAPNKRRKGHSKKDQRPKPVNKGAVWG